MEIMSIGVTRKEKEMVNKIESTITSFNNNTANTDVFTAVNELKEYFDSKEVSPTCVYILYKYFTSYDRYDELYMLAWKSRGYISSITSMLFDDYRYKLSLGATYVSKHVL
jgi:hypothetical protein